MKTRHHILIFISILPLFGAAKKKEADKKIEKPKDIIEEVFESNEFKRSKTASDRYKVSKELLERIANVSEEEKEQMLVGWFDAKEKKLIRSLIFFQLLWRTIFLLIGVTIVSVILYLTGKAILLEMWKIISWQFQSFAASLIRRWPNLPAIPAAPPNTLLTLVNWVISQLQPMRSGLFGFIIGPLETFLSNTVVPMVSGMGNTLGSFMSIGNIISILYGSSYLSRPIGSLWRALKNLIKLSKLYYNPVHEDPMRMAEIMYVKSIYLYLHDPLMMKFLEEQLFNTRSGDISKVNETYQLLKAYRAIPFGVKPVVYDQDLIDERFENYPPKIRRMAERIIAKFVVYTEAMQVGRADLLQEIALKNVLLYGPPGTGKSRVFKEISDILGVNIITLFFINGEDVRGQAGDKIGHGRLSTYGRGIVSAADQRGRVYLNSIIVIEEIDKTPDSVEGFMHIFLDPKVQEIEDLYLRTKLPKLQFIFATTNYKDNLAPAIRDRFTLVEVGAISKKFKKKILRNFLIPAWVEFLANPELQEQYGHYLDPEEYENLLFEVMEEYIDTHNTGPGLRLIEEELERVSMEIMADIFRQEYEDIMYGGEAYEGYEEYVEEEEYDGDEAEISKKPKKSKAKKVRRKKTKIERKESIKSLEKQDWSYGQLENGNWGEQKIEQQWDALLLQKEDQSVSSTNITSSEEENVTVMEGEEQEEDLQEEEIEWVEEELDDTSEEREDEATWEEEAEPQDEDEWIEEDELDDISEEREDEATTWEEEAEPQDEDEWVEEDELDNISEEREDEATTWGEEAEPQDEDEWVEEELDDTLEEGEVEEELDGSEDEEIEEWDDDVDRENDSEESEGQDSDDEQAIEWDDDVEWEEVETEAA